MGKIVDVAVLGAGIAGSSLAKSMADQGWETLLLDSQVFPRHKVCGEFISPEGVETLRSLGVAEQVETLGPIHIERIRLILETGAVIEVPLPGVAWGVSRYSLDPALHQAATEAGALLLTGTTATKVLAHRNGYSIETRCGGETSTIQARSVIAAWGANRRVGLPGDRSTSSAKRSYMGIKTHLSGVKIEPVIEMYFVPGGYFGLCPIEGGRVNLAALITREAFADAGKTISGFIQAAAKHHPRLAERLIHSELVQGTSKAVSPVILSRKPYPWDELPLLGDTATMIPPLCGDGMSMALRSAALCAPLADRYLREELTLQDWEQQYTSQMMSEFNRPLQWGSFLQWVLGRPMLSKLLPAAVRTAPSLAKGLVRATRLK